jgi:hypothetical protein
MRILEGSGSTIAKTPGNSRRSPVFSARFNSNARYQLFAVAAGSDTDCCDPCGCEHHAPPGVAPICAAEIQFNVNRTLVSPVKTALARFRPGPDALAARTGPAPWPFRFAAASSDPHVYAIVRLANGATPLGK